MKLSVEPVSAWDLHRNGRNAVCCVLAEIQTETRVWLTAATICGCCGNDGMIASFGTGFPQSDLHSYQRTDLISSPIVILPSPSTNKSISGARRKPYARDCICDPYSPKGVTLAPIMVLVPGFLPPSRENWELINYGWQFFPLVRDCRTSCH